LYFKIAKKNSSPPSEDPNKRISLITGAVLGTIIMLIVAIVLFYYWRRAQIREQTKQKFFSPEALKNISVDSFKK
jgi:ATP-dependent Zn protease